MYTEEGLTHSSGFCCSKRIHIREKPYVCSVCRKAFSKYAKLREHERTHSVYKALQNVKGSVEDTSLVSLPSDYTRELCTGEKKPVTPSVF